MQVVCDARGKPGITIAVAATAAFVVCCVRNPMLTHFEVACLDVLRAKGPAICLAALTKSQQTAGPLALPFICFLGPSPLGWAR